MTQAIPCLARFDHKKVFFSLLLNQPSDVVLPLGATQEKSSSPPSWYTLTSKDNGHVPYHSTDSPTFGTTTYHSTHISLKINARIISKKQKV